VHVRDARLESRREHIFELGDVLESNQHGLADDKPEQLLSDVRLVVSRFDADVVGLDVFRGNAEASGCGDRALDAIVVRGLGRRQHFRERLDAERERDFIWNHANFRLAGDRDRIEPGGDDSLVSRNQEREQDEQSQGAVAQWMHEESPGDRTTLTARRPKARSSAFARSFGGLAVALAEAVEVNQARSSR
jgi:hypothetical protein